MTTLYIIQDRDTKMYFGHNDRWTAKKDRAQQYTSRAFVDKLVEFLETNTNKRLIVKIA